MKVHFCKSNDVGGLLIRLVTFSRWNHVAIEVGNVVYEAVAAGGVRRMPCRSFPGLWDKTESVSISVKRPDQMMAFLNSQVGKPYDWMALIALPFRTTWQSPHKWFCSELVAKALSVSGAEITRRVPAARVTPRDLWIALPANSPKGL